MMKRLNLILFLLIPVVVWMRPAGAVVHFEEGRQLVDGVMLLQEKGNPKAFRYLPTAPRVSMDNGRPEMLFIKFVDSESGIAGGLVHFLFTLDMAPEQVKDLEKKLRQRVSGARIVGPVDLQPSGEDDGPGGSFRIISATLDKEGFATSVISSGVAPVTPGSRAAVASRLTREGATLLWESFQRPTSDVSVSVSASYEAAITGYEGRVEADLNTVYDHLFRLDNKQQGFKRDQLQEQVDKLRRDGVVKVEVSDRSGGNVDSSQMDALMSMVTNKMVEMLFDTTTGLSKLPEREKVPDKLVKGRQKRGFITRLFAGSGNQRYTTDDQYVLRTRKDIRGGKLVLNFTRNTTIRVPFNTAGNIRGLYDLYRDDEAFNRVIDTGADPAFERREVFFEIDPKFYPLFENRINSISVEVMKEYGAGKRKGFDLAIRQSDINDGVFSKSLNYPRLGLKDAEAYRQFGYRVNWLFRGGGRLSIPREAGGFTPATESIVSLAPPLDVHELEIDANAVLLAGEPVVHVEVFAEYSLLGKRERTRYRFRPEDGELLQTKFLVTDPGSAVSYRAVWYTGKRKVKSLPQSVEGDFLRLPLPDSLREGGES
jgi:hypothetical protein